MTTIVTRQTKGSPLSWTEADANFINLNTDKAEVSVVALKAPLASPDLTGVPTAPTATNGTNTTQLATTAFVQAALEELDTEKASLTGATFSGQVTATKLQTGVSGTNTNNFILDASAADGTMKLERGDGQDIMTVDATGVVAFPQSILSKQVAEVVIVFNGITVGTISPTIGYGVTTRTRNSVGNYTLTFTTPFADANYIVLVTAYNTNSGVICTIGASSNNSSLSIVTYDAAGALADAGQVNVVLFKV